MLNNGKGARIIFKRDSESSIGRGAVIYRAHFRPEVAAILYWAAFHVPKELGGEMWVTEGWRDIRLGPDYQVILHGGEMSLHLHVELDP